MPAPSRLETRFAQALVPSPPPCVTHAQGSLVRYPAASAMPLVSAWLTEHTAARPIPAGTLVPQPTAAQLSHLLAAPWPAQVRWFQAVSKTLAGCALPAPPLPSRP